MTDVQAFQLLAQRGAVKLEKLGMTRRGPSITSLLRKHYGLKPRATHDEVLAKLQADIDALYVGVDVSPEHKIQTP